MSSATSTGKTPARVTFSYLTPNNLGVVRKLNSVLFPVKYAEKYYKDILAPEVEEFCQLGERAPLIAFGKGVVAPPLLRTVLTRTNIVYFNDIPVGNFTCRLESECKGRASLYLMTMGILAVRLRLWAVHSSPPAYRNDASFLSSLSALSVARRGFSSNENVTRLGHSIAISEDQPHIPSCSGVKHGWEGVLRTSRFQRDRYSQGLLQKDRTKRCMGT